MFYPRGVPLHHLQPSSAHIATFAPSVRQLGRTPGQEANFFRHAILETPENLDELPGNNKFSYGALACDAFTVVVIGRHEDFESKVFNVSSAGSLVSDGFVIVQDILHLIFDQH